MTGPYCADAARDLGIVEGFGGAEINYNPGYGGYDIRPGAANGELRKRGAEFLEQILGHLTSLSPTMAAPLSFPKTEQCGLVGRAAPSAAVHQAGLHVQLLVGAGPAQRAPASARFWRTTPPKLSGIGLKGRATAGESQ